MTGPLGRSLRLAAARRREETRAIIAAGDDRAAQLQTPRKPGDPVIRMTKGQDDE